MDDFEAHVYRAPAKFAEARWIDSVQPPIRLAGFAWYEQDKIFRRLPKNPTHKLPEAVDGLANHTAGGQIQFNTDSTTLRVRVKLAGPHDAYHMTAVAQCGVDAYIGENGSVPKYYRSTKFDRAATDYEAWMFHALPKRMRTLTLYFPLYQGLNELSVGLDADARIEAPPPYAVNGPIVIYGTSITQGGCANRPGMVYSNILARRLNAQVINLGFSGSGCGEPELAHTINEIPSPSMIVIDNESNVGNTDDLFKRLPVFLSILREANATVPILVISKPRFSSEAFFTEVERRRLIRRDFHLKNVEDRRAQGDKNIHFFDGGQFYGETDWEECTVDGVHTTDLGFLRMAQALEPVFRRILKLER